MKKWLFNPFVYVAGGKSLIFGLGFILITAFGGWLSGTHFDGVIDIHQGKQFGFLIHLSEGIFNLLIITLLCYFSGRILSKSAIRFIDVIGTQAYARLPFILAAFVGLLPLHLDKIAANILSQLKDMSKPPVIPTADIAILLIIGVISIGITVWYIALVYKAYTVSCNLKGGKAVASFIIFMLIAEIISKYLIDHLYLYFKC